MKKLLTMLVGLLLFATGQGFAQDGNQITTEELREYIGEKGVYRTRTSTRVKGTPYLIKDFKMGYIMLTDKSRSEDLPLRLNTYDQEIEFARGQEVFAIPPHRIKGFVIYNEFGNVVFKNGFRSEEHDVNGSTLLRVIHDGQTKLLAHHVTNLQEDMASYGMASQLDEYIDDRHYYLIKPDGTWEEISLRKRDILRSLEAYRDQIETFAKRNALDYDEEPEVATMLNHYDALYQQNEGADSGSDGSGS